MAVTAATAGSPPMEPTATVETAAKAATAEPVGVAVTARMASRSRSMVATAATAVRQEFRDSVDPADPRALVASAERLVLRAPLDRTAEVAMVATAVMPSPTAAMVATEETEAMQPVALRGTEATADMRLRVLLKPRAVATVATEETAELRPRVGVVWAETPETADTVQMHPTERAKVEWVATVATAGPVAARRQEVRATEETAAKAVAVERGAREERAVHSTAASRELLA
jgi:hypothetical protein